MIFKPFVITTLLTSLASISPHSLISHSTLQLHLNSLSTYKSVILSLVYLLFSLPGPVFPPPIPDLLSFIHLTPIFHRSKPRHHFFLKAFPDSPLSRHLSYFITSFNTCHPLDDKHCHDLMLYLQLL